MSNTTEQKPMKDEQELPDPFDEFIHNNVNFEHGYTTLRSSHGLSKLLKRFYREVCKPEIAQARKDERTTLREQIEKQRDYHAGHLTNDLERVYVNACNDILALLTTEKDI